MWHTHTHTHTHTHAHAHAHTHAHTQMEFYSAIRKNEKMCFKSKWILEDIMLSEVRQAQKDKGCMFSLICRR
jgi:hypothetical protein